MRRIMAVAEYIFKQSFRNKILNVLIIFAVSAMGFSVLIARLAQESEMKLIVDFGLFAIELFAFLTLALSITIQLFEENELKTLIVILTKPVRRHEYLIGKYLGILLTIAMNVLLMTIVLMIVIQLSGGEAWDIRVLASALFTVISMALLTAVALLLTVITTSVPTCIIYLFFIYVLGHITIHLKNLADLGGTAAARIAADAVYYLVPNLELFNVKNRLSEFAPVFTPDFLGLVLGYVILYSAALLLIAAAVFDKKEY